MKCEPGFSPMIPTTAALMPLQMTWTPSLSSCTKSFSNGSNIFSFRNSEISRSHPNTRMPAECGLWFMCFAKFTRVNYMPTNLRFFRAQPSGPAISNAFWYNKRWMHASLSINLNFLYKTPSVILVSLSSFIGQWKFSENSIPSALPRSFVKVSMIGIYWEHLFPKFVAC